MSVLRRLLDAWREAPNVELANRIVAVGALSKTTVTHRNWLEVATAQRAEDVSSLLSIAGVGKSAQLRERIEVLSRFPDDPRIERFVAGLYERPPVTSSGARTFWTQVRPLASRMRDVAAISVLRRLNEANEYLRGQIERVLLDVGARDDVPLSAELSAWLDELDRTVLAPKPKDPRSVDELQAAFLANPHDETLRAVTMDALLEAGDARAKLMVMQLEGADVAKFVKANATTLLGDLAAVIKPSARFDRGWLHAAELRQGGNNSQRLAREASAGNPLWATVEELTGPGDELISVHPVMKSLRTLTRSELRVPSLPSQLVRLLDYRLERGDVLRLALPETLSSLRELHVRAYPADVTLLLRRAVTLEAFRADLINAMPRVAAHVVQQLFQLEVPHVTVGFLGWDGPPAITVEFEREDSVVAAHVSLSLEDVPTQMLLATVADTELLLTQCREFGAVQVTIHFDAAVNEERRTRLAALAD